MSAQQFLERLFGDLAGLIVDEDALRAEWSDPGSRDKLIAVLAERGYDADKLDDMRHLIDTPNSDLFDVLPYIRFTTPARTRVERAAGAARGDLVVIEGNMGDLLIGVLQA